jgi:hypothetical protein
MNTSKNALLDQDILQDPTQTHHLVHVVVVVCPVGVLDLKHVIKLYQYIL